MSASSIQFVSLSAVSVRFVSLVSVSSVAALSAQSTISIRSANSVQSERSTLSVHSVRSVRSVQSVQSVQSTSSVQSLARLSSLSVQSSDSLRPPAYLSSRSVRSTSSLGRFSSLTPSGSFVSFPASSVPSSTVSSTLTPSAPSSTSASGNLSSIVTTSTGIPVTGHRARNLPAIVGGAAGGGVAFFFLAFLLYWCSRTDEPDYLEESALEQHGHGEYPVVRKSRQHSQPSGPPGLGGARWDLYAPVTSMASSHYDPYIQSSGVTIGTSESRSHTTTGDRFPSQIQLYPQLQSSPRPQNQPLEREGRVQQYLSQEQPSGKTSKPLRVLNPDAPSPEQSPVSPQQHPSITFN
ncbi:uncharacterized protein EI90DRAFT_3134522 [Cantharellus anzutake]|uniref:uncharacterized protein n=1 Tax=Cantharellus anzutake TaxID=1750568 RepID=UPI0019061841|nr:uncharacterized protein EI90DRAFT_3134522 [Cantharellus anzutake]KAF8316246.1 hypothetical protein EI90DRAFT_3134522 [Cantharellus anzutake]